MKSWRFAMIPLAATMVLAGSAHADFDTGWKAYQKSDFSGALSAWRPMAESGDARSQFNLGAMYDQGRGVTADPAKAVAWWRKAAARTDTGRPTPCPACAPEIPCRGESEHLPAGFGGVEGAVRCGVVSNLRRRICGKHNKTAL